MRRMRYNRAAACVLLVTTIAWTGLSSDQTRGEEPLDVAARIVGTSGAPGGICAVAASPDAELPLAAARQGSFLVHSLYREPGQCDAAREVIRSRGMYGTVSADVLEGTRLPYTDNLVNLVVVDSYPMLAGKGFSPREVFRVLAPLGCAYVGSSSAEGDPPGWVEELTAGLRAAGAVDVSVVREGGTWVRFRKPWPEDIDEWTHYLHGPDGNPVARDRVVGPPKRFQWTAGPMWQRSHETDSSLSTLVTSRGRLYYIVDEGPISLAGMNDVPDKWFLAARDAFNGVLLWKVPIRRWGWREWKPSWFNTRPGDIPLNVQKRLVAAGDKLYVTLGYQAPVSQLDARSGEILRTYAGTERANEILHVDGTLVLSVLDGDGVRVKAVDAATGQPRWASQKAYRGTTVDYIRWKESGGGTDPVKLDPSLNTATDGRVVALIDGPDVVGLDFATGRERWRSAFPLVEADLSAGGMQTHGNLWIGTMIVSGGVVLHASPNQLAALDADSGEVLWSQPKKYIGHLWYEWKDVFVIEGLAWTWNAELAEVTVDVGGGRRQRTLGPRTVNGYDLTSGELKRTVPLGDIFKTNHHHRCYRNKATLRYILASRRGTEFVDLDEGHHTVDNWVRGTCHVGMMPANGLQYAPPHPCQCYIEEKLSGFNALAPQSQDDEANARRLRSAGASENVRLQRGPAYAHVADGLRRAGQAPRLNGAIAGPSRGLSRFSPRENGTVPLPISEDWPAFRHDSMRSGSVATRVPDEMAALWRVNLGSRVSAPVVAGRRLYVAVVDEHRVECLDTRDGRSLWGFTAGARIDSPPTVHRDTVLFGSADGWVYCLRAADGQLAWRFRGAPATRLIGAFGQLESAWPVHGSVLVEDDTVYFASGRSSQLDGGMHLYGLDAATGELRHQTHLEGPRYTVENVELNYKLPMGSLPDVLVADGEKIYMRSQAFDRELKLQTGQPDLGTQSGFLEGSYFKRMPWTFGGQYARLIVHDDRSVFYVRMFDTLRGLDPTVYFVPGSQGYLLFARTAGGRAGTWSQRIPVRGRAMVLATDRLFVAGPPDVIDPKDPLGAFEGRSGGVLQVFDSASGEKLGEHELPSPPVFNGAAAAAGRFYVADEEGSVSCFGSH